MAFPGQGTLRRILGDHPLRNSYLNGSLLPLPAEPPAAGLCAFFIPQQERKQHLDSGPSKKTDEATHASCIGPVSQLGSTCHGQEHVPSPANPPCVSDGSWGKPPAILGSNGESQQLSGGFSPTHRDASAVRVSPGPSLPGEGTLQPREASPEGQEEPLDGHSRGGFGGQGALVLEDKGGEEPGLRTEAECPMCGLQMSVADNDSLNSHIDACLLGIESNSAPASHTRTKPMSPLTPVPRVLVQSTLDSSFRFRVPPLQPPTPLALPPTPAAFPSTPATSRSAPDTFAPTPATLPSTSAALAPMKCPASSPPPIPAPLFQTALASSVVAPESAGSDRGLLPAEDFLSRKNLRPDMLTPESRHHVDREDPVGSPSLSSGVKKRRKGGGSSDVIACEEVDKAVGKKEDGCDGKCMELRKRSKPGYFRHDLHYGFENCFHLEKAQSSGEERRGVEGLGWRAEQQERVVGRAAPLDERHASEPVQLSPARGQIRNGSPGLEHKPAGLGHKPAGLEDKPAGLEHKPAGLEHKPAGLEHKPAGLGRDASAGSGCDDSRLSWDAPQQQLPLRLPASFASAVVGRRFHAKVEVEEGDEVVAVRERSNPQDGNAVQIQLLPPLHRFELETSVAAVSAAATGAQSSSAALKSAASSFATPTSEASSFAGLSFAASRAAASTHAASSKGGAVVGHLPREMAAELAPLLDAGALSLKGFVLLPGSKVSLEKGGSVPKDEQNMSAGRRKRKKGGKDATSAGGNGGGPRGAYRNETQPTVVVLSAEWTGGAWERANGREREGIEEAEPCEEAAMLPVRNQTSSNSAAGCEESCERRPVLDAAAGEGSGGDFSGGATQCLESCRWKEGSRDLAARWRGVLAAALFVLPGPALNCPRVSLNCSDSREEAAVPLMGSKLTASEEVPSRKKQREEPLRCSSSTPPPPAMSGSESERSHVRPLLFAGADAAEAAPEEREVGRVERGEPDEIRGTGGTSGSGPLLPEKSPGAALSLASLGEMAGAASRARRRRGIVDKFEGLLQSVVRQHGHVLNDEERALIARFRSLSEDSQCLLLRLVVRKGPWIPVASLDYGELDDVSVALQDLLKGGFLQDSSELGSTHDSLAIESQIPSLLPSVALPNLRLMAQQMRGMEQKSISKANKRQLVEVLTAVACHEAPSLLRRIHLYCGRCIRLDPICCLLLQRLQMLFFLSPQPCVSRFLFAPPSPPSLSHVASLLPLCQPTVPVFPSRASLIAYEQSLAVAARLEEAVTAGDLEAATRLVENEIRPHIEGRCSCCSFGAEEQRSEKEPEEEDQRQHLETERQQETEQQRRQQQQEEELEEERRMEKQQLKQPQQQQQEQEKGMVEEEQRGEWEQLQLLSHGGCSMTPSTRHNVVDSNATPSAESGAITTSTSSLHGQILSSAPPEALPRTSPVFHRQFRSGWVYATAATVGVAVLERQKRFSDAISLLRSLLQQPWAPKRRGSWWLRLALDLTKMGRSSESLQAAEAGAEDPAVKDGDLLALKRRVLRLAKPPLRWKRPSFFNEFELSWKCPQVTIEGRAVSSQVGSRSRYYNETGLASSLFPFTTTFSSHSSRPLTTLISSPLDSGADVADSDWSMHRKVDSVQCSVEEVALEFYSSEAGGKWTGVHAEGGVWRAIFALIFWDAIFCPLPNTFVSPFQTAPLDLGTEDFVPSRQSIIRQLLIEVKDDKFEERMKRTWDERRGSWCMGLNWDRWELSDLISIAKGVGGHSLSFICKHLAEDYHERSSGLPDLTLWRKRRRCATMLEEWEVKCVEVKGKNDTLAEGQRVWLARMASWGIFVELCKVVDPS